ncbi:uncharacterized protein L199_002244 [Kwoniella botswanensis]|uniref:uncharacterized protein n=1 Tax=Kwoniella botswanensis TaxID=1268659 RepID=UPI00315DB81C
MPSPSPIPSSPTPSINGSKPAGSDRWKLLSYSLSNTIPYSPFFHITSIIIAFLALVIIALWAAATAGFEPYTVFDTDFNRTDDKHWYTPLLPNSVIEGQKGKLCDPVIFNAGSTIQTNGMYKRMSYTIVEYKILGVLKEDGAPSYASVGYMGYRLDVCSVSSMSFIVDVRSGLVTATAHITCPTPWAVVLSTTYTLTSGVTETGAYKSAPYLGGLAIDLVYRVGKLFNNPLYAKENTMGTLNNGTGKWSRMSGDLNGRESSLPNSTLLTEPVFQIQSLKLSNPEDITSDTSSTTGQYNGVPPAIHLDMLVPLSNFVSAILSTIHSDLGILDQNIFLSETALHRFISETDDYVNTSISLGDYDLHYAHKMLHPASGTIIDPWVTNRTYSALTVANRTIATVYPSHITRSKGLASWLVSVVGLTFSIWGGLWQLYLLIVSYILSKRKNPTTIGVDVTPPSPSSNQAVASKESIPLLPSRQVGTSDNSLIRRDTL